MEDSNKPDATATAYPAKKKKKKKKYKKVTVGDKPGDSDKIAKKVEKRMQQNNKRRFGK